MQNILAKRHGSERRFRFYGKAAVIISVAFLAILFGNIISKAYTAVQETRIQLEIDLHDYNAVSEVPFRQKVRGALYDLFPEVEQRKERRQLQAMLSNIADLQLRDALRENPNLLGATREFWFTASSDIDMVMKGHIDTDLPEARRAVKDTQLQWLESLKAEGRVELGLNRTFLKFGDSREPEQAGFLGALVGSILTVFVCLLAAFPLGVGAAIYLEEFAPKNRFTDIIEVNINNLAAVPSIVFGLLGLVVYLQFFNLPRSAPLVGGLTLALLILPTIVITTRNALKSIPPSIKQAALALGATPMQVMMHHTFPLALPGIMTGTILGVARALGETAPLLMIGMVAFVADVPQSITDPATTMPVQIYLWSDSPEIGFQERTSAGIMVLLGILIVLNGIAAWIRKRYEKTW